MKGVGMTAGNFFRVTSWIELLLTKRCRERGRFGSKMRNLVLGCQA